MRHALTGLTMSGIMLALSLLAAAIDNQKPLKTLVYADFENVKEGAITSKRGGTVMLNASQQLKDLHPSVYSNMDQPWPIPPVLLPAVTGAISQHAGFVYEIKSGQDWASIAMVIQGLPMQEGKQTAEDVSEYKMLRFRMMAPFKEKIYVGLQTRDNGIDTGGADHEVIFPVNTDKIENYQVPLKAFEQPGWAKKKVKIDEVLKKLTAISFSVKSIPAKGSLRIDDVTLVGDPIK
jgi:hypothetical protein